MSSNKNLSPAAVHYGANNQAICELSKLLVVHVTSDLQAVDCVACVAALWQTQLGQLRLAVDNLDVIAGKYHALTNERLLVPGVIS